ncbi:MAG: efflux RND transporter periplasmic adaptor subunit [Gemmataceae bacterium]|nr:efflux RND transporter periplasmic adaptor subunit [Gemmataceae bacterium]MDW8265729.1 efflux RND transporter periplasmic adaptor subunit [Gemmataceae bacterium]
MKTSIGIVAVAAVAAGGVGLWYTMGAGPSGPTFRTMAVERGDLTAVVSATGTVEPVEVIDVGAQVAGQIRRFGTDPYNSSKVIDFGSRVEKGTVLAQLDDSLYAAEVELAKAELGQMVAMVQRAEADLIQAKANLHKAEREWARVQRLSRSKGVVSELDYDTAQAAYETAKSAVSVAEAALMQAQRSVDRTRANLQKAEINLGYTTIRSPVKGVIIDRRVNVGQTVVASFNAPSLFLIATDLSRMQVWAPVNEADIGHIRPRTANQPGQKVRFTVDAFSDEVFEGEVAQIRLNATMTQNVVTYTVVVDTDNSNLKLLPYMTANVQFIVDERKDVLLVPNTALRWRPAQIGLVVPDARDEYQRMIRRKNATAVDKAASRESLSQGVVWVEDGGLVRPIKVRTGLSDGIMTEIVSGDVAEGMELVVGVNLQRNESGGANNPFVPQFRRN